MKFTHALSLATLLVAGSLAGRAAADPAPAPVSVRFAPPLERQLADDYGREERATLEALVIDSVTASLRADHEAAARPAGVRVEVLVEDARPSHPTRQQSFAQPSLDPIRSRSLGGAALSGTLLAADGQVIARLRYADFATDFRTASPATDPWADARRTIERFAAELVRRSAPVR